MATHHRVEEEEDKLNDAVMRHSSDDSEEELEDQNWDDWDDDERGSEPPQLLLCLFCDAPYGSSSSLFAHCASTHHFDFFEIKKAYSLDFYKSFKLINYVRSQVAAFKCWSCGKICCSKEELDNHLHKAVNFEGSILPWDEDKYLTPFLQDDALLYSYDEDCVDEDIDSEEIAMHLSQFERINIDEENSSNGDAPEFMSPYENEEKEVELTSDKGTSTGNPLEKLTVNGLTNTADVMLPLKNEEIEKHSVYSTKIAANEIKNINKNYFGSYSSFGIHRDMISDKVRTDAYRRAILENPSLLRGAVVMDVGCGTGILSLFAAQSGAAKVIAVEASVKMAEVATQIAKDNGLLWNGKQNGVINVVQGMVEELGNGDIIEPHSVDVLISEWMGYCLLYESMLSSVLFARDRWLKPGGAIFPDTATMFVAGFGKGGTSIPFWENVYGFNMSRIGREVVEDAARIPIVDVLDSCNIITTTEVLQSFDLAMMQPSEMDFTATVELEPKFNTPSDRSTCSKSEITWCYGIVLWFDTGFTKRFCKEKPVNLSTSPYDPSTHWSQTILTFREPIAIASNFAGENLGTVGTNDCPAAKIQSRISIVRGVKHRSIDISMELKGIGHDDRKSDWPVQIFNLN